VCLLNSIALQLESFQIKASILLHKNASKLKGIYIVIQIHISCNISIAMSNENCTLYTVKEP